MGIKITLTIAMILLPHLNITAKEIKRDLKPIIEFKKQEDLEAIKKAKLENNIEKALHQESSNYIEIA